MVRARAREKGEKVRYSVTVVEDLALFEGSPHRKRVVKVEKEDKWDGKVLECAKKAGKIKAQCTARAGIVADHILPENARKAQVKEKGLAKRARQGASKNNGPQRTSG